MPTTEIHLQQWIGREETVSDSITPTPYAALSALFDRDPARPPSDIRFPRGTALLLPLHRQSGDSTLTACATSSLPPGPLPLQCGGNRLDFHRPLRCGDSVSGRDDLERLREDGRSGPLVFVQ